ncbi:hypothetical protein [Flavobacterium johnsoniae]|uniref:TonB C-terminal domain-containing protein n=1 Tax=Flavobacterium johnsoniae TaxID=986 RepID=A0A1J7C4J6_FLAJO|nr:hypothetical protein [Flavobacterium johnsoniae]OIV40617.1 hypothetical protein BKM63_17275 [Flavobacterium johnsoniae]
MKSQNRNLFIILLFFLSLLNSYAQKDISKLFFNLPLESSRDSIYCSIKKYGFIEESTNRTVWQNKKIIKTFSGYLDVKTLGNTLADSVKIQLSTASSFIENDNYYQNLLIVWNYHHFSNVKTAKEFYQVKKNEIKKIVSEKPYHFNNYFEDGTITAGYSDTFYEEKGDREVSIELKRKKKEYHIILGYQRNEGEKKLRGELIPKKELIVREIDSKNLFQSNNVQQAPVIEKCSTENDKSIECLKRNIAGHISNDIDFESFGLTAGAHRVFLKFVIDKNAEIINIKVSHKNTKLCQEIMQSINELNIIEPAINKGIKVDFLVDIPLTITIEN